MGQNETGVYFCILALGLVINRPSIYELAAFKINSQIACSFSSNLPMLQFKVFIFDMLLYWLYKYFKKIAFFDTILSLIFGIESLFNFPRMTELAKMSICILFSLLFTIVYDHLKQSQGDKKNLSLKHNVLQLAGLFGSTFLSLLTIFGLNPLTVFSNFWPRMAISFYWLVVLSAGAFILEFKWFGFSSNFNGRRKFYHLICVLLFTPAVIYDQEFLRFSLVIALGLFLGVEYFRITYKLDFITERLSSHLKKSERSFVIILAHIQLLLGCSIPIWLGENTSVALSGVSTLGVGDSLSSIIGLNYGRHKFFASNKTWEGTFGFVIGCWLYRSLVNIIFKVRNNFALYFMDVILALVEASLPSSVNDSLVLSSASLLMCNIIHQNK
jgi:dolichol kinase